MTLTHEPLQLTPVNPNFCQHYCMKWPGVRLVPGHFLQLCWFIIDYNIRNNFQTNILHYLYISIIKNATLFDIYWGISKFWRCLWMKYLPGTYHRWVSAGHPQLLSEFSPCAPESNPTEVKSNSGVNIYHWYRKLLGAIPFLDPMLTLYE